LFFVAAYFTLTPLFDIFFEEEEANFFFFGQTVVFFKRISIRQIREKILKNERHKEEEKKRTSSHLHKKALRVSSKSALCRTREKKRSIKRKTRT